MVFSATHLPSSSTAEKSLQRCQVIAPFVPAEKENTFPSISEIAMFAVPANEKDDQTKEKISEERAVFMTAKYA